MKLRFRNLRYSFRCLGILIKAHPWFLFGQIISLGCLIVQTLVPINIVSKIVSAYNAGQSEKEIFYIIFLNIGILIIVSIANLIIDFLMSFINSHFTLVFSTVLFRKLESIDYDFHEQPDFLDNYTRALDNGAEKIYNVAKNQMSLIKTIVRSIAVFAVIVSIHYLAIVYTIIIGVIDAFLRQVRARLNYDRMTNMRPHLRKRWFISRSYFVKDAIPDIKTTDINDVMLDEHKKATIGQLKEYMYYSNRLTIFDFIGSLLMASIYPVILGIVSYAVLDIKDIASLAALTVAATTISNLVNNFNSVLTDIQVDSLEAKVTFEVLDMDSSIEGKGGEKLDSEFESLEVRDLTFAYTDKDILKDVNLKINKGEKIAIVGANGAGKTTLVKLLLRLYDPKSGSILINGKDYKTLDPNSLRKKVGAVFQNNEDYSVTVAENVLLRKMSSPDDENKVIESLKFGDLYDYVMTLPDGINTSVSKEFHREGTIFSGGQRQKLAVSRGYAQNYELFILDEPSSALDPIAEAKMYHHMLELGKDKTLIFISHRLSATANVDRIYLFENGKIVEEGTHEELLNISNGRYKEMFTSQAEKYFRGQR